MSQSTLAVCTDARLGIAQRWKRQLPCLYMWHPNDGGVRLDLAERSLNLHQLSVIRWWRCLQKKLAQRTKGREAHVHHRYALETGQQLIKRCCLGRRQDDGRYDQHNGKKQN